MIDLWRVNLDAGAALAPTEAEAGRAARFATEVLARRYLAAHAALRAILSRYVGEPLEFAIHEHGKPYLMHSPEVRFNLSHSRGFALIAVSREAEVGVDIEYIRPMPDYAALTERFFPPGEETPLDEFDFFRRWTRWEALLKARGVGLFGAGATVAGDWSVETVDAGEGFAGAVATEGLGLAVKTYELGANE